MTQYTLDNINTLYLQKMQEWGSTIFVHANYLIGVLALIQIIWISGWIMLKGDGWESIVANLAKQIIIIGFFYTLLLCGGQWIPEIINSFSKIGANAGVISTLDPSSVFSQGLYISGEIVTAAQDMGLITHPFGAIMSVVITCVVMFAYTTIAADLIVTLVSVYTVCACSTIFFAFGVNQLTSPMARNLIQKCIALGLKLMGLYAIIGIGTSLAGTWHQYLIDAASSSDYYTSWYTVAGSCIIFWLLCKNIPSLLSSLAGAGSLMTHGAEAAGAVAAGATFAASKGPQSIAKGVNIGKGIGATAGITDGGSKGIYGALQTGVGAATGNAALIAKGQQNMQAGAKKAIKHGKRAGEGILDRAGVRSTSKSKEKNSKNNIKTL